MIELYKRKIWNDDKTVNVIAEACLNNNPKIIISACRFFLILDYDYDSDADDSSDDDDGDKIALLKQRKGSKMTKQRQQKLDRAIKQVKRKSLRKQLVHFSTDFLPIDTIYDPTGFVEKLFSKLKKSNDKYEVKLFMLRLISRMIGRHKIQLLQFYPNLLRYLNSHNKDKISEIFAMIIESCHNLVPPETVRPVIERIISNYVTEYCNNQHITIGLNAIREILLRMPLALDEN
jgi:protein SDA1